MTHVMTWKSLKSKIFGKSFIIDLSEVGLLSDTPLQDHETKTCRFPIRILVVILACIATLNCNTLRLNMSIALVAMVNATAVLSVPRENDSGSDDVCRTADSYPKPWDNTTIDDLNGPFNWNEATRGIILSSYFWGNMVGQIPGGMLADRFGGKWTSSIGILVSALVTLLMPAAAYLDVAALITLRVLCGISQGVAVPAMHSLLAKWIPQHERGRLLGITYGGVSLGKVIVFPVAGLLCNSTFLGGWPATFYVFGGVAVLWFIFWALLVCDKPSVDPKVSTEELLHIQDSAVIQHGPAKKVVLKWGAILRSPPFWALATAYFAQAWGAHTLLTILPSYLKFALDFDMKASGLINGLPYIMAFFTGLIASCVADALNNSGKINPTTSRKIFTFIAMMIPAGCLFGVTLLKCNRFGLVILLSTAAATANINAGGLFVNEMDLSVKAAGTLKGLSNLASNMAGAIAPYAAGLLVHNDESIREWNRVFYVSSSILTIGVCIFLAFGTSEQQQYTEEDDDFILEDDNDEDKIPILTNSNNHRRYGSGAQ